MMRLWLSILGLCSLAILSACGESGTPVAKNEANTGRADGSSQSNARPAPGGTVGPANTSEANSVNTAPSDPLMAAKARKIDAIRQAGSDPSAPKTDIETLLQRSTKPAPENSEFAAALSDVVVERRTFLSHPTLSKVEKITEGSRSTIKVFTTDGRTLDLPGSAIEKLSVASSISILRAAGLPLPPQADRKSPATERN